MSSNIYDIWLSTLKGIGTKKKINLLEHYNSSKEIYHLHLGALKNVEGINEKTANIIIMNRDLDEAKRIHDIMTKENISGMMYFDPEYPARLREIFNPPFYIYTLGKIKEEDQAAISIVGARKGTAYGKWAAHSIASNLAECGVTVVSGMAYGIDSYAHQGALDGNGRTIAVLGCGVNVCYPKKHQRLMEKIIHSGAVISEYPPDTSPNPAYFPQRNRIISGLTKALIVVEAGIKSGSLITAEYALEQGIDIFAVPGNIQSIYSKGTNKLIKEGAMPIIDIDDFLHELNLSKKNNILNHTPIGNDEKKIYGMIEKSQPVAIDTIAYELKKEPSEVHALLTILEIKGLIKVMSGKIIIAK